jgi:ABC-2 type transport system permease protein
MPIHDQSYRRYAGERRPAGTAWMVIARQGMAAVLGKRLFVGLLLLAWVPFVVGAVMAYFNANFPQFALFGMTAQRFRDFLNTQDFFVFLITVWVGAGLIANDKRAGALQIYLSRPLTRVEYVAGKLATLSAFLLLVTWVPAILLLVLQVAFTGSVAFLRQNLYLFPAVTLFAGLQVLVSSFLMLALSSMSRSSRYVAVLYAGAWFFSHAIFGIVYAVTGSTRLSFLSLPGSLNQVGDVVFRLHPRYSTPPLLSVLVLLAVVAVSAWVLDQEVRGVEVVS